MLLEDYHLLEKLGQFNREKIPERVVHARGMGAKGFFEVRTALECACIMVEAACSGAITSANLGISRRCYRYARHLLWQGTWAVHWSLRSPVPSDWGSYWDSEEGCG